MGCYFSFQSDTIQRKVPISRSMVRIIATQERMMERTVSMTAAIRLHTRFISQSKMRRGIRAIIIAVEIAICLILRFGLVCMILRFPRVGGSEFPAFDLYVCTAELAIFFASVLSPLSFRFGGSTKVTRSAIQVFRGKYYLVRVWRFSSETPAPRTCRAEIRGHNFAAQTERPETDRKKWQFAVVTTYMGLELGSPTWWEADSLITVM